MRRTAVLVALALLGVPACGGDSAEGDGGVTRTVLADHNFDEFATSLAGFFPRLVTVRQGDTIDFKQAWTGEPHTVTFGKAVQPLGDAMATFFENDAEPLPEDEPADVAAAYETLPEFFADDFLGTLDQSSAQPCYLDNGTIPDGKCPKREQPPFTGRELFYNSGFIPYEGNTGNNFTVDIAADADPGKYFYYCVVHGPLMGGFVEVKAKGAEIPSQDQVTRLAREQIDKITSNLAKQHKRGLDGEAVVENVGDADVFVGAYTTEEVWPYAFVNEFYPKTYRTKVGQKVTWGMDYHTVSFRVPKYGSQVIIDPTGAVSLNENAYAPQGGPGYPKPEGDDEGEAPPEGGEEEEPPAAEVDVGEYDGTKFLSSGVPDGAMRYSITFTKPGRYAYACLIHPEMVGTVVVEN